MQYTTNLIGTRLDAIDDLISLLTDLKMQLKGQGLTVAEAKAIIKTKIETAEAALNQKISDGTVKRGSVEEVVDKTENISTRLTHKIGDLSDKIGDQLKKHVSSNIDGLKRWTGLIVSLAILPATCWMLNKIYPWFMDKVFPDLSDKKNKAKAGEEKKVEVA